MELIYKKRDILSGVVENVKELSKDEVTEAFDTQIEQMLIDAEGNIRYRVRGNPGWEEESTIKIIKQLISEQTTDKALNKTDSPQEAAK